MNVLLVHPSPLMYTKIYLRLEPLGLELVAAAARRAGHDVTLIDLQVESHASFVTLLQERRPDAIGFSCNYLANVPEIVDLARLTKQQLPRSAVFVGGHSASFVAQAMLEHADGAIDCVLKGEGESADYIVGGAEWSTLAHDAFPAQEFDFMLANPPYGKSWKKDLEALGGKDGMRDPRFKVMHRDEELSLVTRSSDGQMLFEPHRVSRRPVGLSQTMMI